MCKAWRRNHFILTIGWSGVLASLIAVCPTNILFTRFNSQSCVPQEVLAQGIAKPLRPITQEEIHAFQRDGSVILRNVLQPEWTKRLRELVTDAFQHPTAWDVLYTRFVANFYGAQKSIFLHHTSKCGQEIAKVAPTTAISLALLQSQKIQVCEPTDALGNFWSSVWFGIDGCGTTGYHTDDAYFPIGRKDPAKPAVVRLWIKLAPFSSQHFSFSTLNDSEKSRIHRERAGLDLFGTSYKKNHLLETSGLLDEPGQVIDGSHLEIGDIFAFAGETPHSATAHDCAGEGGHACLRLILSFAGNNSIFQPNKSAALIPLYDNQSAGEPPQGKQFPTIFGSGRINSWEWETLSPSWTTLSRSWLEAIYSGVTSFSGTSLKHKLRYFCRCAWFTVTNVWSYPVEKGEEQLSLSYYFFVNLVSVAVRKMYDIF